MFVVSDFISEPGWEKALGQLAQRHEKTALRYASLSIVREAMGLGQTVRRHIPPLLFLLAMALLLWFNRIL